MKLDSYIFSDCGGRDHNEDAAGMRKLPDGMLYAAADGLGGHERGELASQLVVETLKRKAYEAGCDAAVWLQEGLADAHQLIMNGQTKFRCTMRSTAAALLVQKTQAYWSHVGDSRLYYLHDGCIEAVTEDHSVAYKKYKAGSISRAQIAQDEDQSSLLRALGNPERHQPDSGSAGPIVPGDAFLLCSDGVWTYLPDEEILVDYLKARTAQQWGELLLLRVMERIRQDSDNLTLITVLAQED